MTVLGKRKKPESAISQEDAEAIFRRHFEAQFQPIDEGESKKKSTKSQDTDGSDDQSADSGSDEDGDSQEEDDVEGDEWGGLSGDSGDDDEIDDEEDDEPAIEVIDHSQPRVPNPESMSKSELKAFMSSRPPDQSARSKPSPAATASTKSSSTTLPEDAPSLLAQDLELRRLLSESHLLASPTLTNTSALTGAAPKLFAAGRVRHKAADLRMQALGSKESILKQQKMPMNMRKGINAAAAAREAKRRREAKENNVILEHDTAKKRRKRDRGRDGEVNGPSVGRMRGAELRISDRDVRSIEGTRDVFGRKGGKGKRR
ncbi:unnamed protein product [Clonostachys chloroleuca]|uniref:Protein FAF1 n=1 Tax=Clonostachys chloroleuca TaxID=1926264 RepID=A0AA35M1K6_9HYPO|nr:unnamed protein product [Clonostachys chloroleuca]